MNYPTCFTSAVNERVTTAVLVGAIAGQLGFGFFADYLGRRRGLVATLSLLVVGAALCAAVYAGTDVSALFWLMTVFRFVLGVGIGGIYPVAASTASESSEETGHRHRGRRVLLVFAMQGVGAVVADVVVLLLLVGFGFHLSSPALSTDRDTVEANGSLLVACNGSSAGADVSWRAEAVWRLAYVLGVFPPLFVLFQRLKLKETEQYSKMTRKIQIRWKVFLRKYWKSILAGGGCWMLWDAVFYGNSLFMSEIIASLGIAQNDAFLLGVFSTCVAVVALPGYFLAAFTVDRIGRKRLQMIGFGVCSSLFFAIGIFYDFFKTRHVLFLIVYGAIYFFFQFGPNSTTFLIASELFPTPVRARAHGICAAIGKLGAVTGKYFSSTNTSEKEGTDSVSDSELCLFCHPSFYLGKTGSSSFSAIKGEGSNEHTGVLFLVCGSLFFAGLLLTAFAVTDKTGQSLNNEDEQFKRDCVVSSIEAAPLEEVIEED